MGDNELLLMINGSPLYGDILIGILYIFHMSLLIIWFFSYDFVIFKTQYNKYNFLWEIEFT